MSMAKKSSKKSIQGSQEHVQDPIYAKAKSPVKTSTRSSWEHGKAPSYAEACNTAAKGMKDHGKAPRTTKIMMAILCETRRVVKNNRKQMNSKLQHLRLFFKM